MGDFWPKYSKFENLPKLPSFRGIGVRGLKNVRFLLQKARPCVNARRLCNFVWKSVEGSNKWWPATFGTVSVLIACKNTGYYISALSCHTSSCWHIQCWKQDQKHKTKTKAARPRPRPRPVWDRSYHTVRPRSQTPRLGGLTSKLVGEKIKKPHRNEMSPLIQCYSTARTVMGFLYFSPTNLEVKPLNRYPLEVRPLGQYPL